MGRRTTFRQWLTWEWEEAPFSLIGMVMLLCLFLWLIVGGIRAIQSHHPASQIHYPHKYLAGQCVVLPAKESWEHPIILRIEMAGDDNYLVRVTPASLYRDQEGLTLSFPFIDALQPTTCPGRRQ